MTDAWTSHVTGRVSSIPAPTVTPDKLEPNISEGIDEELVEPYVAFNIWSYEDGELKLSAVRKIPAREVLGSEFYSDITGNTSDGVMVLTDSFLITKNNTTYEPEPSPEIEIDEIIVMDDDININKDEKIIVNNDNEVVVVIEPVVKSESNLSPQFKPQPIASPISNVYDFVSYIINNEKVPVPTDMTNSGVFPMLDGQENNEVIINVPTNKFKYPTPTHNNMDFVDEFANHENPNEVVIPLVMETFPQPTANALSSGQTVAESKPETTYPEPPAETLFNLQTVAENNQETVYPQPPTNTLFSEQTVAQRNPEEVSSVFITPEGLVQNDGANAGVDALQELIASLQGYPLTFDINQTSVSSHKIQVSLINDDGIPIDSSALENANLISILSNQPTVINHHIYQINGDGISTSAMADGIQSTTNNGEASPATVLSSSLPEPENVDSYFNPPTFISTPEQDLLNELEEIQSFNDILSGLSVDHLDDPVKIETVALKGILDVQPDLVKSVPTDSQKLDISKQPGTSSIMPTPQEQVGDKNEGNLNALEELLKRGDLPKDVEIAMLSDILSGFTVSEALSMYADTNSDSTTTTDAKNGIATDNISMQSPLTVIDSIERNHNPETTETYVTRLNIETIPVRASTSASVRLQNCFQDRTCTFALAVAVAAGTTGALTVPLFTPFLGRSIAGSIDIVDNEIQNELMTINDARKIISAITKYSDRNGESVRGSKNNLRNYIRPYVNYLGHKIFPKIFGAFPPENGKHL